MNCNSVVLLEIAPYFTVLALVSGKRQIPQWYEGHLTRSLAFF